MKQMTPETKKKIMFAVPLVLLFYLANKFSQLVRLSPGADGLNKMINALSGLSRLLEQPLLSFYPTDLLVGLLCAGLVLAMVHSKSKKAKKFRQDVEYGSARWGTAADIRPFMDKDPRQNVILTQTEGLMMGSRPKNPKHARNKNILVIGGSGSGTLDTAQNTAKGL